MSSGKLSPYKIYGKSWFFGIGINEYIEFPNLANAVHDVQSIQSILCEDFDVDENCVINLFDQDATEEKILEKLDFLAKEVKKDDKLIIYYSGHGRVNQDLNRGYWMPHDAKQNSSSRYILNSTIQDYVGGIDAQHILLISDSCFSGSIFMRGEYRSADVTEELENRKSRWALCSGRADEEVYDGEIGGHSPFAQSLINALSAPNPQAIPIGRLVNQVIEETASNYEQLPDGRPMFGVGHGGGQYVFRKKTADSYSGSTTSTYENVRQESTYKQVNTNPKILHTATSQAPTNQNDVKMVKWIAITVLGAFVIVGGIIFGIVSISGGDETPVSTEKLHVVKDMDGEVYPTVTIGTSEWMAVNMKYMSDDDSDWSFLHDLDEVEELGLGQLYSYEGAVNACSKLNGSRWRLPTAKDIELLATFQGSPPLKPNNTDGYSFANVFADWVSPHGNSGLNLQLGGKYLIGLDEFSPLSFDKLNAGHYWLSGQRILNITSEASSYFIDMTSKVPWNHACSCRCVRDIK